MQYLGADSKMTQWSVCFQGKPVNIIVIQVYAQPQMPKKLKQNDSIKNYKTFYN